MKIIVANLKMNLVKEEMEKYLKIVNKQKFKNNEIIVCPSTAYLSINKKYNKFLCSQNIYQEEQGSYTGEISAKQVKSLGINYTIINHSERNIYFNENNEIANSKLHLAMENNLIPIVCLGDSKEEKDSGKSIEAIKGHLDNLFKDVSLDGRIVVAYEPLYAIGTNVTPTIEDIKEVSTFIKTYFNNQPNINVIYGGSVNETNVDDVLSKCNVDGVIIGKHINKIENLVDIIKKI